MNYYSTYLFYILFFIAYVQSTNNNEIDVVITESSAYVSGFVSHMIEQIPNIYEHTGNSKGKSKIQYNFLYAEPYARYIQEQPMNSKLLHKKIILVVSSLDGLISENINPNTGATENRVFELGSNEHLQSNYHYISILIQILQPYVILYHCGETIDMSQYFNQMNLQNLLNMNQMHIKVTLLYIHDYSEISYLPQKNVQASNISDVHENKNSSFSFNELFSIQLYMQVELSPIEESVYMNALELKMREHNIQKMDRVGKLFSWYLPLFATSFMEMDSNIRNDSYTRAQPLDLLYLKQWNSDKARLLKYSHKRNPSVDYDTPSANGVRKRQDKDNNRIAYMYNKCGISRYSREWFYTALEHLSDEDTTPCDKQNRDCIQRSISPVQCFKNVTVEALGACRGLLETPIYSDEIVQSRHHTQQHSNFGKNATPHSLFNNYLDEAIYRYRDYQFVIAFENNVKVSGYITEKVLLPILAHAIPIVYSNNEILHWFDIIPIELASNIHLNAHTIDDIEDNVYINEHALSVRGGGNISSDDAYLYKLQKLPFIPCRALPLMYYDMSWKELLIVAGVDVGSNADPVLINCINYLAIVLQNSTLVETYQSNLDMESFQAWGYMFVWHQDIGPYLDITKDMLVASFRQNYVSTMQEILN